MKTDGQRLYEHQHPEFISVIPVERRHFTTAADVFDARNPADPTPWRFLTKECQAAYERQAVGHHSSSKAPS